MKRRNLQVVYMFLLEISIHIIYHELQISKHSLYDHSKTKNLTKEKNQHFEPTYDNSSRIVKIINPAPTEN